MMLNGFKRILTFGLIFLLQEVLSLDNGLALTPPMGWMAWERYRCIVDCETYPDDCIHEKLFMKAADLIVSEGYKNLGYNYIIVDDCWLNKTRDEHGNLQPDNERFPSGIKALADYIHSKGLKFGLYEDFGTKTCAGYPGIQGHLERDAKQFVAWDVDYIKLDACHSDLKDMKQGYIEFGRYLNESGRPIVYSCSWPAYTEPIGIPGDYETLANICNLWRNWDDIDDSWNNVTRIIDFFADNQDRFIPYAGPGHWNDPDMLIIGNFGLSLEQSKSQMAIWAIMAAPLIMSNDLENVRPEFKEILQNQAIIAVNQDPLGIQGRRLSEKKKIEIWTRPVSPIVNNHHSYAIAVFNRRVDGRPYFVNFTLTKIGLTNFYGYYIKDLFDTSAFNDDLVHFNVSTKVPPTGVRFFLATPKEAPTENADSMQVVGV